jgi:quercetin 2,3-dioxygenase
MSAGAGIRHTEYKLEERLTQIFQIWIIPSSTGGSTALGRNRSPRPDLSGRVVTRASGFDNDKDALRTRRHAEGGRSCRIRAWRRTFWLPGACL